MTEMDMRMRVRFDALSELIAETGPRESWLNELKQITTMYPSWAPNGHNGHTNGHVNGYTNGTPPPAPPSPPPPAPPAIEKLQIHVGNDIRGVTDRVLAIIAKYNRVFQSGGKLVELQHIPNVASRMHAINAWRLKDIASEYCKFVNYKVTKTGDKIITEQLPPDWLGHIVTSRATFGQIPTINGLAHTPTLRKNGTLITERGFDVESGILLASDLKVNVPTHPTQEDARYAFGKLEELISDFRLSPLDRSVWISGLLSVIARHVFGEGPAPLFAFSATKRGSGKSLLSDLISIIANGMKAPRSLFMRDETEMDKRIRGLALSNQNMVLFDNITVKLASTSLDMAITAESYEGRTLGKIDSIPVVVKCVWFANGNGLVIGADTARRTLLLQLNPQCEHPEYRRGPEPGTFWRFPNIEAYTKEHRAELLAYGLTIVSAYLKAGSPKQKFETDFGSFAAWSGTIRASVIFAGGVDPCLALQEAKKEDVDENALEQLMSCWPVAFGTPVTASELIEQAGTRVIADPNEAEKRKNWRNALLEWLPATKGELPTARELGYALRGVRGTIVKGAKIVAGTHTMYGIPWTKVEAT